VAARRARAAQGPGLARLRLLQLLTAAVWAAVVVAGVGRFKLAARPPLKVDLKTTPPQVRVTLDGRKLFDGTYVATPVGLEMPPGKHRLKIARDGYIAHAVSVEGDSADVVKMDDVMLERAPGYPVGQVDLRVRAGDPEVYLEVDDGFLAGQTPIEAEDLQADAPHTVAVYPAWPERDEQYRCRFIAPPSDAAEPLAVDVTLKNGRVTAVSNCQKLKPREKLPVKD
jgi:hypothetical protein